MLRRCEWPGDVPIVPVDEPVSFCVIVLPVSRVGYLIIKGRISIFDRMAIQRLLNLLVVNFVGALCLSLFFICEKIFRSLDSAVRR